MTAPPVQPARSGASRYLRASDLRALRHLAFASHRFASGALAGKHRSRQRGQSAEFEDYRPYLPGDELGDVDWKVFGRSDRLYVKLYEHESDLTVTLLVDASASMAYTGIDERIPRVARWSKYDQACRLAAAIAFLIVRQGDRVSIGLARDGLHAPLETRSSIAQLLPMVGSLEDQTPAGPARLDEAIDEVARRVPARSVLIVLSDLLDESEATVRALTSYVARGGDAIVFQVLHQDELELPSLDGGHFVDSETQEHLRLQVDDVRSAYEQKIRAFLDTWSRVCRARGIDHTLTRCDEPSLGPLERYLVRRRAARRH